MVSVDIRREFSLNEQDYAQILTLFFLAYAIMYAGSGYIIDRLGTRRGFAVFISGWSIAQLLHGFAIGKWSLGTLPLSARPQRAGRLAGRGESDLRMVSGIPARAGDGNIQRRVIARLRARALYCCDYHAALRMALCVRFHRAGRGSRG